MLGYWRYEGKQPFFEDGVLAQGVGDPLAVLFALALPIGFLVGAVTVLILREIFQQAGDPKNEN